MQDFFAQDGTLAMIFNGSRRACHMRKMWHFLLLLKIVATYLARIIGCQACVRRQSSWGVESLLLLIATLTVAHIVIVEDLPIARALIEIQMRWLFTRTCGELVVKHVCSLLTRWDNLTAYWIDFLSRRQPSYPSSIAPFTNTLRVDL